MKLKYFKVHSKKTKKQKNSTERQVETKCSALVGARDSERLWQACFKEFVFGCKLCANILSYLAKTTSLSLMLLCYIICFFLLFFILQHSTKATATGGSAKGKHSQV